MNKEESISESAKEDILTQLERLGKETKVPHNATAKLSKGQDDHNAIQAKSEKDILAELTDLASANAPSRSTTPSIRGQYSHDNGSRSPKRTVQPVSLSLPHKAENNHQKDETIEAGLRRSSATEDTSKEGGTTTNSIRAKQPENTDTGTTWWGGFVSTATAAVNHAQTVVKELHEQGETQSWVEQVRGNVNILKGLGDIRSMTIPTLENIIKTIVPPIESHEQLKIHVTHDMTGYPPLEPLIFSVFNRVMAQVEGGNLMVIQKGKEAAPRQETGSGDATKGKRGWDHKAWWRGQEKRNINPVKGVTEGGKLSKATAESYASEYFSSAEGVADNAHKTEELTDANPTRVSAIFLAIQAVDLSRVNNIPTQDSMEGGINSDVSVERECDDREMLFAAYLYDPVHLISFHAYSQAVPKQWINWLEHVETEQQRSTIESGGLDPREWAAEWLEETLLLAVGIVAQRYVAQRMGIGVKDSDIMELSHETKASLDSDNAV